MRIEKREIYERQPDGSTILISIEEIEIDEPTPEELLKEKQDELLKIYNEIQLIQSQIEG